jgi:hypothetical protein
MSVAAGTLKFDRLKLLLLAAFVGTFAFHGALLLAGSYRGTYDAYVHIFFGDHYRRAWFSLWETRWYTGFTMVSYPPLTHQLIGLISQFTSLTNAFVLVMLGATLNTTLGVYRFSRLWVGRRPATYAVVLTLFSSSIAETVHVFGQLPTMFVIGVMLNALPFVWRWVERARTVDLLRGWALLMVAAAGHHVTTLFGMVFFCGPIIATLLLTKFRTRRGDEPPRYEGKIAFRYLFPLAWWRIRRVLPALFRTGVFGVGLILILVITVLPYWLWSKSDPITQISIPHSSRDSFLINQPAGLMFFLIPWGMLLVVLPYAFYKGFGTRNWILASSLAALALFGTGGTTPIPAFILRGAFYILTLDRFTFWGTILILPLAGQFVESLLHGRLGKWLYAHLGAFWRFAPPALFGFGMLVVMLFTANLTQYRKFQPAPLDMTPIVEFLAKDNHDRWRYMTLGFGDQMAWLSAQTTALNVEGNYHSARRLPELTTTPIERLDGAKFTGIPGLGSLQQFVTNPQKYNLKYIFVNDAFYEPLLYFAGWHRLGRLDNDVIVWERSDVPPLPAAIPQQIYPDWQRLMWGTLPVGSIVVVIVTFTSTAVFTRWRKRRAARRALEFPVGNADVVVPDVTELKTDKAALALPSADLKTETIVPTLDEMQDSADVHPATVGVHQPRTHKHRPRRRLPDLRHIVSGMRSRVIAMIRWCVRLIYRLPSKIARFARLCVRSVRRVIVGAFTRIFALSRWLIRSSLGLPGNIVRLFRRDFPRPKQTVLSVRGGVGSVRRRVMALIHWAINLISEPACETAPERGKDWQFWRQIMRRFFPRLRLTPLARRAMYGTLLGIVVLVVGALLLVMLRRSAVAPEGVILAYYDAIDFKRFSESYDYLETDLTRPDYLRWLSLRGGLVASFAKLNNLFTDIDYHNDREATATVTLEWVTSLGTYPEVNTHEIVLTSSGWRIQLDVDPPPLPRETFTAAQAIDWSLTLPLGSIDETALSRGVLDRSMLSASPARLVYVPSEQIGFIPIGPDANREGRWHGLLSVVGWVTNRDPYPAHVTISAILRDAEGNRLAEMNAMDTLVHQLLPGESTPYRVDFFGSEASVLLDLSVVASVEVSIRGVPTAYNLNRPLVLSAPDTLYNGGAVLVDIPRVLVAYRDGEALNWVEGVTLEQSIAPGEAQPFTPPPLPADLVISPVDVVVTGPRLEEWTLPREIHDSVYYLPYGFSR